MATLVLAVTGFISLMTAGLAREGRPQIGR
jgi:hypothetical protein